jgi:regulatory protein
MQLALTFPQPPLSVNNRAMSSDEADKKDAAQKLRNRALRLLTTREHSREELLRKLAQAKVQRNREQAKAPKPDKDDIASLVDDLAAQGWQSDDRYAEAIVRRLTGQASRRFIGEKLAQAGIKKEVAEIALEALEQDEKEVALALWTRRFGDVPKDDKERQRQIRFLLSRGFHLGDAFKLVPRAAPITTDTERDPRAKFGSSGSSARANLAERTARFGDPGDAANATSPSDSDEPSEPIELTRTSQTKSLSPNKPRSSFGRSRPWGRKNEDQ